MSGTAGTWAPFGPYQEPTMQFGIAATGTTQATATQLFAGFNHVGTVAAGNTGVILPSTFYRQTRVLNRGAVGLLVYPPVGSQIEAAAINAAVTIAAGGAAAFIQQPGTVVNQY